MIRPAITSRMALAGICGSLIIPLAPSRHTFVKTILKDFRDTFSTTEPLAQLSSPSVIPAGYLLRHPGGASLSHPGAQNLDRASGTVSSPAQTLRHAASNFF